MRKIRSNSKKDLSRGKDFIGVTCCFYCHDGQGRLLLSKRSSKCRDEIGCWDVGGGALEFGESFEEAARREIKEEYCTKPVELTLVGPHNAIRQTGDGLTHWVAIVFVAKLDPKKVKIGEPDKMEELGWFEIDNLPQPMHSQAVLFLDQVKNYIIST